MPQKLRLNLTIPRTVKHDLEKRKKFNASAFFEKKYREEFLMAATIKDKISSFKEEIDILEKRLVALKETGEVMKPKANPLRCPVCDMFFHEDISIRKKVHIYKSLFACQECVTQRAMSIKDLVQEMKELEESNE